MPGKEIDYATTGLTIRTAMLDFAKRNPSRERKPIRIRWGQEYVQTSDRWAVPNQGRVRIEILQSRSVPRQGVDLKVDGGAFLLADGSRAAPADLGPARPGAGHRVRLLLARGAPVDMERL